MLHAIGAKGFRFLSKASPRKGKSKSLTSAGPFPPAPPPCMRHTTRASLRRADRYVFRVRRARFQHAETHCARSFADAKLVALASMRPGNRRDLLEQPAVSIRITKRCERSVTSMRGIRTIDPDATKYVRLVRACMGPFAVEHFADLDAATEELVAGRLVCRKRLA